MGGKYKKNWIIAFFFVFIIQLSIQADSKFGFLSEGAGITPKAAKKLGVEWLRPHPGYAIWNDIESEPGVFDWDRLDRRVRKAQNHINKPFWITEVQLDLDDELETEEAEQQEAIDLVTGYVKAFKAGAKKIFYTIYESTSDNHFNEAALIVDGRKKPAYYALETLINKVDNYSRLTKIAENQYRFKVNNEFVYVLWGNGSVPASLINENLKITDILGNESAISGNELVVNNEPIYVEIIN